MDREADLTEFAHGARSNPDMLLFEFTRGAEARRQADRFPWRYRVGIEASRKAFRGHAVQPDARPAGEVTVGRCADQSAGAVRLGIPLDFENDSIMLANPRTRSLPRRPACVKLCSTRRAFWCLWKGSCPWCNSCATCGPEGVPGPGGRESTAPRDGRAASFHRDHFGGTEPTWSSDSKGLRG